MPVREAPEYAELDRRFDRAMQTSVEGADRLCVLFSGGVDSSLVALVASGLRPVVLETLAGPGARDAAAARTAAQLLGLPLQVHSVSREEILQWLAAAPPFLRSFAEPARSVQVALGLALASASCTRVLVGQGADELFGGYAHFRGLAAEPFRNRRRVDWDRLTGVDWPASRELASSVQKELKSPFLDPEFADLVLHLTLGPPDSEGLTKSFFRSWARHRGVPDEIALRPKLAFQYGSGVAKVTRDFERSTTPRLRLPRTDDRAGPSG
ncbi:MAG TPA: asparagine synthase-related protein [Thermoplasmata archaeon]|nr:asparagine synthase-related protein [Thermoplasmata archaeon]